MSSDARDITGFLYEIGLLKRYPRTGWSLAGSRSPNRSPSIPGADPQHAAFLALWHDTQETRTTDLPHLAKRYVTAAPNETGDRGSLSHRSSSATSCSG